MHSIDLYRVSTHLFGQWHHISNCITFILGSSTIAVTTFSLRFPYTWHKPWVGKSTFIVGSSTIAVTTFSLRFPYTWHKPWAGKSTFSLGSSTIAVTTFSLRFPYTWHKPWAGKSTFSVGSSTIAVTTFSLRFPYTWHKPWVGKSTFIVGSSNHSGNYIFCIKIIIRYGVTALSGSRLICFPITSHVKEGVAIRKNPTASAYTIRTVAS